MTVVVTGASGFIGSWLVRALTDDGSRVTAQMRRKPSGLFASLDLHRHELVDVVIDPDIASVVRDVRPRTVFHLAGMSQIGEAMRKPMLAYEANARQTWLLLEAIRDLPKTPHVVVASTDSIYGETGDVAASEDHPLNAMGPYEVSKLMADVAARAYAAQFGLPIVVARLGNIYGRGDLNDARILPSLVRAIRTGGVPHLRGGGRAVRSFLHVDDCVEALRLLAARASDPDVRANAFNVCGNQPMTTAEIVRIALDGLGRRDLEPEVSDAAPGETSVKVSSPAKLRRVLGWSQAISFAEGIARLSDQLETV